MVQVRLFSSRHLLTTDDDPELSSFDALPKECDPSRGITPYRKVQSWTVRRSVVYVDHVPIHTTNTLTRNDDPRHSHVHHESSSIPEMVLLLRPWHTFEKGGR